MTYFTSIHGDGSLCSICKQCRKKETILKSEISTLLTPRVCQVAPVGAKWRFSKEPPWLLSRSDSPRLSSLPQLEDKRSTHTLSRKYRKICAIVFHPHHSMKKSRKTEESSIPVTSQAPYANFRTGPLKDWGTHRPNQFPAPIAVEISASHW